MSGNPSIVVKIAADIANASHGLDTMSAKVKEFAQETGQSGTAIAAGMLDIGESFNEVAKAANLGFVAQGVATFKEKLAESGEAVEKWGKSFEHNIEKAKEFGKRIVNIPRIKLGSGLNKLFDGAIGQVRELSSQVTKIPKIGGGLGVGLSKIADGFDHAIGRVKEFSTHITKIPMIGGSLGAIGSGFGKIGGLALGAVKAVAQVGLAIGATAAVGVGALAALAIEQGEEITQTKKLAASLGVLPAELVGVQYAAKLAGVGADVAAKGLQTLSKNIGLAKKDTGPASSAFKQLGLSAKGLASMSSVEAMKTVADKLKELPTHSDRAATAFAIFGKSGAALLPMLERGAEGIEEASKEADRLGLSFSQVDGAKVEAAFEALARVGEIIKGIGRQIMIQVAPYVEALAEQLMTVATSGDDMGKMVGKALEWIGTGVGVVADVFSLMGVAFSFVQAGITKGLAALATGFSLLAMDLEPMLVALGLVDKGFADTVDNIAQDLHKLAAEQFKSAKVQFMADPPSAKIKKWSDDVKASAQKNAEAMAKPKEAVDELAASYHEASNAASNLAAKLQGEMKNLGLTQAEQEIAKLKDKMNELYEAGRTGEADLLKAEIERAEQLDKQLNIMKEQATAQDKLKEAIKHANEEFVSPLDKLNKRLAELDKMKEGFTDKKTGQEIKLDPKAFDRAKKAAIEEFKGIGKELEEESMTPLERYTERLEKLQTMFDEGTISKRAFDFAKQKAAKESFGDGKPQFANPLEFGSQEARSAILQNRFKQDNGIPQVAENTKAIADNSKAQLDIQRLMWLASQKAEDTTVFTIGN